ncbi:large conductance mechanosensitive channel protein MscL [Allonocardiopsis opalescens]|uniref:Large conductance mechanosensitive channel n=1 Tax=Allonocardiopsis opalescens TaxID=1144618 RepID=A0A2T0Q982_9ACTN|nr:large conductance mechanosensitive channel protein MscL [Allonocardiopsis opalescens]PRY00446.1 large conductance mechanosensitive channel [Allonocardiopsis opalescens]
MSGFRKFLLQGNLVQLAVAVVIGAAFSGLVTSFTDAFISPLLALLMGGLPDFSAAAFTVGDAVFQYGLFVDALIDFVIMAAIIYFLVVLPISKVLERITKKEEATEHECPECRSLIPLAATRCKFCTSEVAAAITS